MKRFYAPPIPLVTGFPDGSQQHEKNLQALLRACIDRADFQTAASVAAVLLSSQRAGVGEGTLRNDRIPVHAKEYDYLLQVCSEILQRGSISTEELQQSLRKIAAAHANLFDAEGTRMVLAMLLIEQGSLEEALLLLDQKGLSANAHVMKKAAQPFTCHALSGLVRHHQLLGLLRDAAEAAAVAAATPGGSGRPAKSPRAPPGEPSARSPAHFPIPGGGSSWGQHLGASSSQLAQPQEQLCPAVNHVFCYDPRLWLKASSNRQLKEVWRECEKSLKAALQLHPCATLLSFALCHLYIVAGKFTSALEAARAAAIGAPHDLDAAALHCLIREVWLEQQDEDQSMGRDAGHDSAADFVRSLELDGSCQVALMGLLACCTHCPKCMLRAAQGCMLYLDLLPTLSAQPLQHLAWACLAACLCGLAETLLLEDLGVVQESAGRPGASSASQRTQLPGPDAEDPFSDPNLAPSSARGRWELIEENLRSRACWWGPALRQVPWGIKAAVASPSSGGVEGSAGAGNALPPEQAGQLAHRAAACCFILGPEHAGVSQARSAVAASLQRWQGQQPEDSARLQGGLCEVVGLLQHAHSLAERARMHMHLLRQPQCASGGRMQAGRQPLPSSWWRSFPAVRRRT